MLDAVFSFRGRIGRLQYLMGCFGIGVGATLAIVLAIIATASQAAGAGRPPLALIGLLVLVVAPICMWVAFSLQARRFRDIGWNPLHVIPAWIGFCVVDELVARAVPSLSLAPLHNETIVGALINLGMAGVLLFWPGHAGEASPPTSETFWPKLDDPSPPTPAHPVRPAPSARPRTAPVNAGFGRRGL